MNLDWSQAYAYNYASITEVSERNKHLNDYIKKNIERVRKVEPISSQSHLGKKFDAYA